VSWTGPGVRLSDESSNSFFKIMTGLLTIQLAARFNNPPDAFPSIITNKWASGYVFGFHDAFARRLTLLSDADPAPGLDVIRRSYTNLFGEIAGHLLFNMSIHWQTDHDFKEGRMAGGIEMIEFVDSKTPPLGLGNFLILGTDDRREKA
jgi:hypothetical protein